jgi:hypothetical protein
MTATLNHTSTNNTQTARRRRTVAQVLRFQPNIYLYLSLFLAYEMVHCFR